MTIQPNKTPEEYLSLCRTAIDSARQGGNDQEISLTLADLGRALFGVKSYQEGLAAFKEAEKLAKKTGHLLVRVQCLATQSLAYQDVRRFHDAFQTVDGIVKLAEKHKDDTIKCDAFISQAQILADSGEPLLAFEKAEAAHQLAKSLGDERRVMTITGVIGNLHLALNALPEAIAHFEMAAVQAAMIGDQRAECAYMINKGTVVLWQKAYMQAIPVFEQAVSLAQEIGDIPAQIAGLRYLVESLSKSNQTEQTRTQAQRGIQLSLDAGDYDALFHFFTATVFACYRLNRVDEAHHILRQAAGQARTINDTEREVEMLLNLGESFIALDQHQQALPLYQDALKIAKELQHNVDTAHIIGRLGLVLAELGHLDEAIAYHRQAIGLARQHENPALLGEQWSMLALAYQDKKQHEKALSACKEAIEAFSTAGLQQDEANARHLLARLESGITE